MAAPISGELEKLATTMVTSTGYCYSDISSNNPNFQTHFVNHDQLQSLSNQEIYNLTTSMEMTGFIQPDSTTWHNIHQDNRLLVDDPSLRCVFPCEGNERPSRGLSLSLSSSNPSTIGLPSFELRQQDDIRFGPSCSSRDHGFFGKSMNIIINQQQIVQDGFLGKPEYPDHHNLGYEFYIRHSKYLGPTHELLNEFCNLGTKKTDHHLKVKPHKTNQWQDEIASSLYSLELLELQRIQTKLLKMLDEVDRRFKNYGNQMKAVVSSFEAVAGIGAATVYLALVYKAMSRHFRCLRDGILGHIKAIKKAIGDKNTIAPGASRGETPRLRLLDQTLRQQKAFQQMSLMESHPWRPQRGLPERSVSVLRAWLFEHFLDPYPSDVDKLILARQTGLSRSQVSNWFINARVRLWKPMVEEMYLEETKEQDNNMGSIDEVLSAFDDMGAGLNNQNPQTVLLEDQKRTQHQLVRIDSDCLSSINHPEKNVSKISSQSLQNEEQPHNLHHQKDERSFSLIGDSFGAMELDFSSYNHHTTGSAVTYGGCSGGGGGGVSLTLGLQQHGGSGVDLAFSPTSQSSLFYPRDHMEDCQPVQYSLLDGEGQNLPYKNLMGAQLLHDLA